MNILACVDSEGETVAINLAHWAVVTLYEFEGAYMLSMRTTDSRFHSVELSSRAEYERVIGLLADTGQIYPQG